jgi:hypothetical protein
MGVRVDEAGKYPAFGRRLDAGNWVVGPPVAVRVQVDGLTVGESEAADPDYGHAAYATFMGPNLRDALLTVADTGAAFVPHAIPDAFLADVAGEAARITMEPLAPEYGVARQEGSIAVLRGDFDAFPAIAQLRGWLVDAVRAAGLDEWCPDEASVQRYEAEALGITPHRDSLRYRYLVAVATIEGTAEFTLCENRDGDPLAVWETHPGSLVLLRGPGLAGVRDGRPIHMVRGPAQGVRTSVGFRQPV